MLNPLKWLSGIFKNTQNTNQKVLSMAQVDKIQKIMVDFCFEPLNDDTKNALKARLKEDFADFKISNVSMDEDTNSISFELHCKGYKPVVVTLVNTHGEITDEILFPQKGNNIIPFNKNIH